MADEKKTLAIIGGGAAGLAAAIRAGDCARERGASLDIVVYENDDRVGRSILATGNGRCNFSNSRIDVCGYHNAEFVGEALSELGKSFGEDPVHIFFRSLGLVWREEDDGRQYPKANKASVVVDVLRAAARELGVREECESTISSIDPPRERGKRFTLRMRDGILKRADAVIMACGGRAIEAVEIPDAERVPLSPTLGPLKVTGDDVTFTRELDNIRVKCLVSLMRSEAGGRHCIAEEAGELMFRKYGVSGICVFNLSRFAEPGDVLQIDFLQAGGVEEAQDFLVVRSEVLARRFEDGLTYEAMLRGLVLPRVGEALLKRAGIDPMATFRADDAARLARILTACPLEVTGIADADICQVRRGGLSVGGFDPKTMQSRGVPNFYSAGEALDVDGPCGGYNLHWAWASGLLAGQNAVAHLFE